MKYIILASVLAFSMPAFAQQAPPADATTQALSQMLQETLQSRAQDLTRAFVAEAKLKVETARADAAEKKLSETAPKP